MLMLSFTPSPFQEFCILTLKDITANIHPIQIRELRETHDRFLIIDRNELYHIGASLKDLGKRPVVSLSKNLW
jgi:hypothetical protein